MSVEKLGGIDATSSQCGERFGGYATGPEIELRDRDKVAHMLSGCDDCSGTPAAHLEVIRQRVRGENRRFIDGGDAAGMRLFQELRRVGD